MSDLESAQKITARTPESLFNEASRHCRNMSKPDLNRVDELHHQLAPLVDNFKPTDDELLSVLATFIWAMPYTEEQ